VRAVELVVPSEPRWCLSVHVQAGERGLGKIVPLSVHEKRRDLSLRCQ
jgi:hypothetical protein